MNNEQYIHYSLVVQYRVEFVNDNGNAVSYRSLSLFSHKEYITSLG